ncbi:MAG: D-2-hydroxyacid dehydrogenase [Bacteroidota bacterium]
MKIVVLDGNTVNNGDLSWAPFERLGEFEVYPRSSKAEILQRAKGADAILINKAPISRETLSNLPELKYIGILATGYNTVDTVAARERSIPVCNAAGYASESVAQHVFALLLELTNHVALHDEDVKRGGWTNSPDWTYQRKPMMELWGKTMGIIGLGRIGQTTARVAQGFGMKVIAHNRSPKDVAGVEMKSLKEVFAESDVISLHCPLTAENKEFINAEKLALMKSSAILINTGRGPLIQEVDLASALNEDKIRAAGLDVLHQEPPNIDNPLIHAKNCITTPHNAWGTRECRERLIQIAAENLENFQKGNPTNVVN